MEKKVVGLVVALIAMAGCGGQDDARHDGATPVSAAPPTAPEDTLATFEGSFDAESGVLDLRVVSRGADGIHAEGTLPYGSSNAVYLHTVSKSWSSSTK